LSSNTPKNVLVVGMPRSGTSMTASIFTRNGYFVAENESKELRKGDEFNPSGYWEAESLIKCNAEIFEASGFQHNNTWLFDSITDNQASNISKVTPLNNHKDLISKFENNRPWIWKDPRLCYTLSYWWPLLNPETTRVLLLKRDPNEIYNSFLRVKWRTPSETNKLDVFNRIEHHLKAAKKAIEQYNIPHVEIHYSDYKNNPDDTVKKINQTFNIHIQTNDIGYNHKLNNQSFNGVILRIINRVGDILPSNIRTIIKKLIPTFVWKIINPNRYSK